MLGKLIKYDLKALSHYFVAVHAMLLAVAAGGRIFFTERMIGVANQPSVEGLSSVGRIVFAFGIALYIVLFFAAVLGTLWLVAAYFYKNLFSDEGYLTHTLPVSRGQILAAKTIAGSLWVFIDGILVFLSMVILLATGPLVREFLGHKDDIRSLMGIPRAVGFGKIGMAFILLLAVSAVGNVLLIYVSIALGQLFSSHRILGAMLAYFGMNTLTSALTSMFGVALGRGSMFNVSAYDSSAYDVFVQMALFAMGSVGLIAIACYVATYVLLHKTLNLS